MVHENIASGSRFICWISFNFKSNNALLCPHSDGSARILHFGIALFAAIKIFASFFYERPPNLLRRTRITTEVKTKQVSENRFVMDEDVETVRTKVITNFKVSQDIIKKKIIYEFPYFRVVPTSIALHKCKLVQARTILMSVFRCNA